MRNWPKTLRPASFRGVPFRVESEKIEGYGRNVAVFEFLKTEEYDTEDMGRKALKLSVSGYVAGDTADRLAEALVNACSREGEAALVLPFIGQIQARCTDVSTDFVRDKLGFIRVDMKFVRARKKKSGAAGATPVPARLAAISLGSLAGLLSPVAALASGVLGAVSTVAAAVFTFAAPALGLVMTAAAVAGFARSVADIVLPLVADADRRERLETRLAAVVAADGGATPAPLIAMAGVAPGTPGAILAAASETVAVLREAAEFMPAADAPIALRQLALSIGAPVTSLSPAVTAAQEAPQAFTALFRVLAATEIALADVQAAVAPTPPADSDREAVARFFPIEVMAALDTAFGHVMTEAAQGQLGVAKRSRLQSRRVMPSTALAWALYGDPARGSEIVALNRSGTAFALPPVLDVTTPATA